MSSLFGAFFGNVISEGSFNNTTESADQTESDSSSQMVSSVAAVDDEDLLMNNRQILMNYLSYYVVLDTVGYPILGKSHSLERLKKELAEDPFKVAQLADIFEHTAFRGDAGYAHDIRTFLAGQGISSPQVQKGASSTRLDNSYRPYSYTDRRQDSPQLVKLEPPSQAYIDLWGNAIWEGYKRYRELRFQMPAKVAPEISRKICGQDSAITPAQKAHYEISCEHIKTLHQEGRLIARCSQHNEAKAMASNRSNMANDILSTTLIPKERSLLEVRLFASGAEGVLLDPRRAHSDNFCLAFQANAGTAHKGFLNLKNTCSLGDRLEPTAPFLETHRELIKDLDHTVDLRDGACSIEAQRNLLETLETIITYGEDIYLFRETLTQNRQDWEIGKESEQDRQIRKIKDDKQIEDAKKSAPINACEKLIWKSSRQSPSEIYHNEMVFYRGIGGDLLVGLFVDSQSYYFYETLKDLFTVQDHIRRTKGRFLPIFEFDKIRNQFHEMPPNAFLLNYLELNNIPALKRPWKKLEALKNLGLNEKTFLEIKKLTPHIRTLVEWQFSAFHAERDSSTDIKLLRNTHLFFPTIFPSKHPLASNPNLCFTLNDISSIRDSQPLSNLFSFLFFKNMEKILGIKIETSKEVQFVDKGSYFHNMSLPEGESADVHFTNAVARAMQTILLLNMFDSQTDTMVCKIIGQIRKQLPHFGYQEKPVGSKLDTILDSDEMQAILAHQHRSIDHLIKIAKKSPALKVSPKL